MRLGVVWARTPMFLLDSFRVSLGHARRHQNHPGPPCAHAQSSKIDVTISTLYALGGPMGGPESHQEGATVLGPSAEINPFFLQRPRGFLGHGEYSLNDIV